MISFICFIFGGMCGFFVAALCAISKSSNRYEDECKDDENKLNFQ